MTNPMDFFKQTYDVVPDWVEKMNTYAPDALLHYTNLRTSILCDGALTRKEKELILVGINAARRYEKSMILHTKGAVDAGASIEEIADILVTCVLSRGIPAWLVGVKAIEYAIDYTSSSGQTKTPTNDSKKKEIESFQISKDSLTYYEKALGDVPSWVTQMMSFNEDALLHYSNLRQHTLTDDVVSRKLKELVLTGINVSERYEEGVKIHTKGARDCGATNEELAECHLTAVLTAGIPAWFEGSAFL